MLITSMSCSSSTSGSRIVKLLLHLELKLFLLRFNLPYLRLLYLVWTHHNKLIRIWYIYHHISFWIPRAIKWIIHVFEHQNVLRILLEISSRWLLWHSRYGQGWGGDPWASGTGTEGGGICSSWKMNCTVFRVIPLFSSSFLIVIITRNPKTLNLTQI